MSLHEEHFNGRVSSVIDDHAGNTSPRLNAEGSHMSQYAILIYEDPTFYVNATPETWAGVVEAHNAFTKGVFELGGSLTGGGAMAPITTAKTIKAGGAVTDGPFVDTKEAFGGYYVIEARDLEHATEIAKLCPAPGGGVEVRPLVDPSSNPF